MAKIENAAAWIDAYLAGKAPALARTANALRKLAKQTVPGLTESVNPWRIPTLESNGPMCFFMVGKHHVTFGFLRATALADPHGLLEGTGKNLRHVKLRTLEDLRRPGLKNLMRAAARLNKKEPMEGMRPKRKKK